MTSDRKTESNRRNSKKSTGPNSERGKSHSRFNALETGIYRDPRTYTHEEVSLIHDFKNWVWSEYKPEGIIEMIVADELAFNMLRRCRLGRAERSLFDKVHTMELAKLAEQYTGREHQLYMQIATNGTVGGKLKSPLDPKEEEIVENIKHRIKIFSEQSHINATVHVGAETIDIKRHLDRQLRGVMKDIATNISTLKSLQKDRLKREANPSEGDSEGGTEQD
jgi:hypothetical protein